MDGFKVFISCMFALGASVCGMVSAYYLVLAYRQRRFSRRTAGHVVSMKPYRTHERLSDGRTVGTSRYSCTLETMVDGMAMRVRVDSGKPLEAGSRVMFWYDPEHPRKTLLRKARHTYALWALPCMICAAVLVFIFMFWH